MSRRQRSLKQLVASVFLAVLILEIGLRFLLGNIDIVKTVRHPPDGRCIALAPNTTTNYTGTLGKVSPVKHNVNRFGYRGKPLPQKKPEGTLRIAVLGDSFAFGQGVEDNQTIPYYLEQALNKKAESRVEVLNFGVPGYNFGDFEPQFALFAFKWHPDLVLFFLFENDLDPPLCKTVPDNLLTGFLIKFVYITRPFMFFPIFFQSFVKHNPEKRAKKLKDRMEKLNEAVQKKQAKLLVVVLADPLLGRKTKKEGEEKELLSLIMDQLGISWLDGRGWLAPHSPQALPRIPKEGHLSAEANRQAATQIADWLIQLGVIQGAS